jgi:ATP-binding cassette subfamily B protein RaxB
MMAEYHGHQIDIQSFRQRFGFSLRGSSLNSMLDVADQLHLAPRVLRAETEALPQIRTPAILHWGMNHFVVLKKADHNRAIIHDPAAGVRRLSLKEVAMSFTGVAIELTPTAEFKPAATAMPPITVSSLWSDAKGLRRATAEIFLLTLVLQILILAGPLYMQFVIDETLSSGGLELLAILSFAFAGLILLQAVAELLRSLSILLLGTTFGYQLTSNVFHHLIRLEAQFFEKRQVGDIASRVSAAQAIQLLLTTNLPATLVDGGMALLAAVILFLYNPVLALVVVFFLALHVIVSWVFFAPMQRYQEEAIAARARESSELIQSIGVATIVKLMGAEHRREQVWRNAYVRAANANARFIKYDSYAKFAKSAIAGGRHVAVLYFGALYLVGGEALSLGMLLAFVAYSQLLWDRASSFSDQIVQLQFIRIHLGRVAEIVGAARERETADPGDLPEMIGGSIALEDVSFRYSPYDPVILHNVSLNIAAGEFVAITGKSGEGKTTLLKVMLGLYPPTTGKVLVEGVDLSRYGARRWREAVGVVMQEDQLLPGSIADNVSFFDPSIDMTRVKEACRFAHLSGDIEAMPMGYLSLIGDLSSGLSGGQRQRLLLARAFYRQPRILVLDEGTANLDETTEKEIADVLENMSITRIVIAHRPELIRRAARTLRLGDGGLVEL